MLLAIDALGVNRGEVIRLWTLTCLFQIPTAYVCARLDTPLALMLVMAVTVLQAAIGTAMSASFCREGLRMAFRCRTLRIR